MVVNQTKRRAARVQLAVSSVSYGFSFLHKGLRIRVIQSAIGQAFEIVKFKTVHVQISARSRQETSALVTQVYNKLIKFEQ